MRGTIWVWLVVVWTQRVLIDGLGDNRLSPTTYAMLNQLAALADASYCISETTRIRPPYQCHKCDVSDLEVVYQWFTYHADCGYVAITTNPKAAPPEVIVALRGTHSLGDSVQDLKADLVPCRWCDQCQVHRGFWEYYQATISRINPIVMPYIRQGHHLRIIGHLLGGAIGVLLAGYYARLGIDLTVVTLGAPRIGNTELAQWLNDILGLSWFPVCHKHDAVPTVPQPYAAYGWQVFIDTELNELPPSLNKVYWCNGCIDDYRYYDSEPMMVQPHLEYFRTLGLCQWQVPSPPAITVTI